MTSNLKNIVIGLILISASLGALGLKPTKRMAERNADINLETLVPLEFAGWKFDKNVIPLQVDPQKQEVIKQTYSQVLSRTYYNERGERVMLSVAYGGDQTDTMQVHKPEACYPAQGFRILKNNEVTLDTGYGNIPAKRLLAQLGSRVEPITYWITIGETVAVDSIKWKLERVKYGLTGNIPDGMLFRVSSIGDDEQAYILQQNFIKDLLKSVPAKSRQRLMGNPTL